MESPLARKVPHCRVCGLPRKGHPRGLCGSPGTTPERERSSSMTPQAAASPKPLMPGRFGDQRPSEVFVDTPLLDRIGPKVEAVFDVDRARQDLFQDDGPKQEEPDYGVGLGNGVPPPLRAQQNASALGARARAGPARQRYPTTPLRQMPTLLLNESTDTILPEHSISNARIHVPTRVFSAGAAEGAPVSHWQGVREASSTSANSTSLVSDAPGPGPVPRPPGGPARNLYRAPSSDVASEAPSLTWSDAIRETGAKPLAVLYAIPTRFGAYLQNKSRRNGADALMFPMENGAAPDNDQAVLVHGERDFMTLIRPHRNVEQQEQRQRTPARSHRTTPSHTPVLESASPVNQVVPPSSPHVASHAPYISQAVGRGYFGNILYMFVGVFIGVSLTFYFLLRLDFKDDGRQS